MVTVHKLSENSRQGFEVQKPTRVGLEGDLSRNSHWGCGHFYDQTPVDIAVYVRNDPVNLVDPDGRDPLDIGPGVRISISITVIAPPDPFLGQGWYGDYMSGYWMISNPWGRYGEFLAQLQSAQALAGQNQGGGGSYYPDGKSAMNLQQALDGGMWRRIESMASCKTFLNTFIANLQKDHGGKGPLIPQYVDLSYLVNAITGTNPTQGNSLSSSTKGNTITLGTEHPYGGDAVSALFHEGFHLAALSLKSSSLTGTTLQLTHEDLIRDAVAAADFPLRATYSPGDKINEIFSTKCGPLR